MPSIIHLLCDIHLKDNIKEKPLKLEFTKSEVGTLIKDIFDKQIKNKVEKGLADSLIDEQFTATMTVSEQKMEKHWKKGGFINISKITNCTK